METKFISIKKAEKLIDMMAQWVEENPNCRITENIKNERERILRAIVNAEDNGSCKVEIRVKQNNVLA